MRWLPYTGLLLIAGILGLVALRTGPTISSSPTREQTHALPLGVDLDPLSTQVTRLDAKVSTLLPTATRTPRPDRTATPRPTLYPLCAEAGRGETCRQQTPTAPPPTLGPATATPTLVPCGIRLNGEYPELCRMEG
jgi:hypothetical protein